MLTACYQRCWRVVEKRQRNDENRWQDEDDQWNDEEVDVSANGEDEKETGAKGKDEEGAEHPSDAILRDFRYVQ